jgi:hypothetical protein
VCLVASACGASAGTRASTRSSRAAGFTRPAALPPGGYLHSDADQDPDDRSLHVKPSQSDDVAFLAGYGKPASPVRLKPIAALLKRYYAASAASDAAQVCALLVPALARELAEGAGRPAPGALHACAAAVSPILAHQHARLLAEGVSTMVVVEARVKGPLALAVLGFRAAPVSQLLLERERGTWRVDSLFDSVIT